MSNKEIIAQLRAENQQLREQLANMSETASEIVFEKHAFRARVAACEAMLRASRDLHNEWRAAHADPEIDAMIARIDALLAEGGKGGGGNG